MKWKPLAALVSSVLAACSGGRDDRPVTDQIGGILVNQQRTVERRDFARTWPFSVGTGTLGCTSGAVVFRAGGVNYALNDAALARGFAPAGPIRLTRHVPPSTPLARLKQEHRMRIFADVSRCDGDADRSGCRGRVERTHGLSGAELQQIETEGRERGWPPLTPERIPLDSLVDAGLRLCPAS